MTKCNNCGGDNVKNLGMRLIGKSQKFKFQCQDCGFVEMLTKYQTKSVKRYIISSIQNDTEINEEFFKTLKSFAKLKDAEIMLLPTKYLGHLKTATWDDQYQNYIVNTERNIGNSIKILGDLYLLASLENPISGFDAVSKGRTVIVGHGQYQMKSLPTAINSHPLMLTSTGSVTHPNVNTNTKVGKKAIFNHSYSALYISVLNGGLPDEEFHIRALMWDGEGFYDIDGYYIDTAVKKLKNISALVTGDEHIIEIDPEVAKSVYGKDGIVEKLKPEVIIRHDVFSGNSISHHNKGLVVRQNLMNASNEDDLQKELDITCTFIVDTTPKLAKTYIVASNHNEHLDKWLNDSDSNLDRKNAHLYHWFLYKKLSDQTHYKTAFETYFRFKYPNSTNVTFLDRDNPVVIHDIEINNHGDQYANGQYGGIKQFSKHTMKTIIGHSHQPGVDKGAYCVGTSSKMKLSYTSGLTSWMHSHVIVYPNGKRQHINIINGRWFV